MVHTRVPLGARRAVWCVVDEHRKWHTLGRERFCACVRETLCKDWNMLSVFTDDETIVLEFVLYFLARFFSLCFWNYLKIRIIFWLAFNLKMEFLRENKHCCVVKKSCLSEFQNLLLLSVFEVSSNTTFLKISRMLTVFEFFTIKKGEIFYNSNYDLSVGRIDTSLFSNLCNVSIL